MSDDTESSTAQPGSKPVSENEEFIDKRLTSLFPDCDAVKQAYDSCFQNFFPRFLKGEKVDPCVDKLKAYQDCLRKPLAGMGLNLDELITVEMDADKLNSIFDEMQS